jgi:hypothetical protein
VSFRSQQRRAQALLAVVDQYLPVRVEVEGLLAEFNDWRIVAPGLIGDAASILDSIVHLSAPRHTLGAEILTRSMADYVITFAWLAAEPENEEQRAERLNRFEADEYDERERSDQKYTTEFRQKSRRRKTLFGHYMELIEIGKMPSELLCDQMRERIKARREIVGANPMPPLLNRAFEADEYWIDHSGAVRDNPLAHQWGVIFSWYSSVAHPSVTAATRVVSSEAGVVTVGKPTSSSIESTPYGRATVLFGLMLHVAGRSLGWPSDGEIDNAFSARRS